MYTLHGRAGWGSVLVEAQLAWYGLPFRFEPVDDLFASAAAREALGRVNPIAQVPTLILPDGRVMTESAAITLHLADVTRREDLVPGPQAAERAAFLRWLVFLVANVYPCFTYADDPSRFVEAEASRKPFRKAVDAWQQRLWTAVEEACGAPWFLGPRFSALDIYLAAMTHWRPRRAWFAAHAPRVHAAALAAEARPELAEVWRRNFPAE